MIRHKTGFSKCICCGVQTKCVEKCGGKPRGGIMVVPPVAQGMAPSWGVYVTVDDVDATAKLAEEKGGKILMRPQDIPKVGCFCVLKDQ